MAASINCITTGPAQASIRDSSVRLNDLCTAVISTSNDLHALAAANIESGPGPAYMLAELTSGGYASKCICLFVVPSARDDCSDSLTKGLDVVGLGGRILIGASGQGVRKLLKNHRRRSDGLPILPCVLDQERRRLLRHQIRSRRPHSGCHRGHLSIALDRTIANPSYLRGRHGQRLGICDHKRHADSTPRLTNPRHCTGLINHRLFALRLPTLRKRNDFTGIIIQQTKGSIPGKPLQIKPTQGTQRHPTIPPMLTFKAVGM
ncbi:conserved hypothetical protein [Mycobacterium tuberculosis]|nr:conserved hypothetical protein [Mycobacterium tuberculosis]